MPVSSNEPRMDGIIAGGARVLRELIRSPRVVKTARIVLGNLDPEGARELMRVVMFQDSALFLDLVTAAPALANTAFSAGHELFTQLLTLPDSLLDRLVPRLLGELSAETLGEATGLGWVSITKLLGQPSTALRNAAEAFERDFIQGLKAGLARADAGAPDVAEVALDGVLALGNKVAAALDEAAGAPESNLARTVARLASGLKQIAADNPQFVSKVAQPLAAAWRDALEGQP